MHNAMNLTDPLAQERALQDSLDKIQEVTFPLGLSFFRSALLAIVLVSGAVATLGTRQEGIEVLMKLLLTLAFLIKIYQEILDEKIETPAQVRLSHPHFASYQAYYDHMLTKLDASKQRAEVLAEISAWMTRYGDPAVLVLIGGGVSLYLSQHHPAAAGGVLGISLGAAYLWHRNAMPVRPDAIRPEFHPD